MSYDLQPHPLADMIQLMLDEEFEQLKEDIREHGLREKIVLFEGRVLDGRHRYRALEELNEPLENNYRQFDPETEGDPLDFVISLNVRRRHLTVGQLASVGFELAKLLAKRTPKVRRGRQSEQQLNGRSSETVETRESAPRAEENSSLIKDELPKTQKEILGIAAEKAGTNVEAIQKFSTVEKKNPKAADAVRRGEKSLHQAATEERQKVYSTDYDIHTRKPILVAPKAGEKKIYEVEMLPRKTPSKRDEAARMIKNAKSCIKDAHDWLCQFSELTGEDFTPGIVVDVEGIMAAITASRVGRDAIIGLEWPDLSEDEDSLPLEKP